MHGWIHYHTRLHDSVTVMQPSMIQSPAEVKAGVSFTCVHLMNLCFWYIFDHRYPFPIGLSHLAKIQLLIKAINLFCHNHPWLHTRNSCNVSPWPWLTFCRTDLCLQCNWWLKVGGLASPIETHLMLMTALKRYSWLPHLRKLTSQFNLFLIHARSHDIPVSRLGHIIFITESLQNSWLQVLQTHPIQPSLLNYSHELKDLMNRSHSLLIPSRA